MRTAVVIQSNYIPWKGYFDLINMADELILFDSVQYTRRDWRNRNKIKTPNGTQWLTIPVHTKGKYEQRICDTQIQGTQWRKEHWKSIQFNYGRAPHFDRYRDLFEALYMDSEETSLSKVNYSFLTTICDLLGIKTRFTWSMDYELKEGQNERLIDLCQKVDVDVYLSGPSAKAYMDEQEFVDAGIQVEYMNYDGYPEYPQLHPPFDHAVSVIDLLFNVGEDAPHYMKSFQS